MSTSGGIARGAQGNRRMRILFFEDNAIVRLQVRRALWKHGWEVISFPDPAACSLYQCASCACHAAEVCADAIVTDFDMPHLDGLTFVKELLEKGCRIENLAMLSEIQDKTALARAKALGLSVFSKAEGIPALLEWLQHVETQIQSERRLICWAEA